MDLEQNKNNKQFFANMITGQQEIERKERKKDREKLGKAMFSINSGN